MFIAADRRQRLITCSKHRGFFYVCVQMGVANGFFLRTAMHRIRPAADEPTNGRKTVQKRRNRRTCACKWRTTRDHTQAIRYRTTCGINTIARARTADWVPASLEGSETLVAQLIWQQPPPLARQSIFTPDPQLLLSHSGKSFDRSSSARFVFVSEA
eukprot:SAG31_NODE_40_length_31360_cov_6.751575_18_plen_157_part_00